MVGGIKAWGAALALILLGGSAPAAEPVVKAPAPSKPVDLNRLYSGAWVEIARHPTKLTASCIDGGISYEVVSPTKVKVSDYCHADKPDGKLRSISGTGMIKDPGTNAKMHVSYQYMGFIPIGQAHWVLDHADDYSWFIQADPSFENLWIFTREAQVDPALLKDLVARAKALGYDPAQLEFPGQR
jgi:apolipoprotein D and lipocalin family protein